jgi:hypothetical protein
MTGPVKVVEDEVLVGLADSIDVVDDTPDP